jgi:hypothetical protein
MISDKSSNFGGFRKNRRRMALMYGRPMEAPVRASVARPYNARRKIPLKAGQMDSLRNHQFFVANK